MKFFWIVGLAKADRRANVVYGANYFPRKFYYKKDVKALIKALESYNPPIQYVVTRGY